VNWKGWKNSEKGGAAGASDGIYVAEDHVTKQLAQLRAQPSLAQRSVRYLIKAA
jgi:hypothetical protein